MNTNITLCRERWRQGCQFGLSIQTSIHQSPCPFVIEGKDRSFSDCPAVDLGSVKAYKLEQETERSSMGRRWTGCVVGSILVEPQISILRHRWCIWGWWHSTAGLGAILDGCRSLQGLWLLGWWLPGGGGAGCGWCAVCNAWPSGASVRGRRGSSAAALKG